MREVCGEKIWEGNKSSKSSFCARLTLFPSPDVICFNLWITLDNISKKHSTIREKDEISSVEITSWTPSIQPFHCISCFNFWLTFNKVKKVQRKVPTWPRAIKEKSIEATKYSVTLIKHTGSTKMFSYF